MFFFYEIFYIFWSFISYGKVDNIHLMALRTMCFVFLFLLEGMLEFFYSVGSREIQVIPIIVVIVLYLFLSLSLDETSIKLKIPEEKIKSMGKLYFVIVILIEILSFSFFIYMKTKF